MCGGTSTSARGERNDNGLSPRVRGNRVHWVFGFIQPRSIPACAGEPARRIAPMTAASVYPRVCGGTSASLHLRGRAGGLSPRVRGNRAGDPLMPLVNGSIPACAGEPPGRRRDGHTAGVYPRVCGGTRPGIRIPSPHRGLSPRVRGNRGGVAEHDAGLGSIPACAGEPSAAVGRPAVCVVYPRVCGGTYYDDLNQLGSNGLSPRVRGNPLAF